MPNKILGFPYSAIYGTISIEKTNAFLEWFAKLDTRQKQQVEGRIERMIDHGSLG
jgi:hypothetical protein